LKRPAPSGVFSLVQTSPFPHPNMKRSNEILVLAVALAAAVFVPQVNAAQETGPKGEGRRGEPAARQERRAQHLAEALGLSADQQAKIKAIHEQERAQVEAIRADQSLSREQKMEKRKALREATVQQVDAILTPEQRPKAQAMREKMRERMKDGGPRKHRGPGHGGDDDMDGPPPPTKGE
jgi:Spy/CpxP family protein refolding chaperone